MSDISERLLKAITEKEMSYGELAHITKIPKSALQRYATGETEKIPIDRLEKIAAALNVSAAYLMGWEQNENDVFLSFVARAGRTLTDEEKKRARLLWQAAFPGKLDD